MKKNTLIPLLNVKNVRDSLDFYERAFGFKTKKIFYAPDNKKDIAFAKMSFEDQVIIMLKPQDLLCSGSKSPSSLNIISPSPMYVYCKNIDRFYEKAIKEGAISLATPHNTFWSDRVCKVLDHDGYEWMFALRGEYEYYRGCSTN